MSSTTLLLPVLERVFAETPPADVARALGRADRSDGEPGRAAQLRRHFALLPNRWSEAAISRLAEPGADADDVRRHAWLRVDPAHLRAGINGVVLLGTGDALGLDATDSAAFLPALKPLFGDAGFQLDAPHPARWYLRLPEGAPLPPLLAPDEALGEDLFASLPQGEESVARRWRSLITEAQVILHQHPRNRERLAQGRAAINALWFWGAGRLPDAVQSRYLHVRSQEPLLQGLARMAGAAIAAPESPADGPAGDSLVDMRRLRSLELFGTQVLPPLLQAMTRREYDTLQLDFEDGTCLALRPGQRGWQFWRRPLATLVGGAD